VSVRPLQKHPLVKAARLRVGRYVERDQAIPALAALASVALTGPFELIVAADIIAHLSCPGAMLDSIKPLCSSASRLVVTTPHAFGLPNFLRFLAGRLRDGNERVMSFNSENICSRLQRYGVTVERLDTCYQAAAERGGWVFRLGRALFGMAPRLNGKLFVVARPA
jgi:hypothetical protein